MDSSHFNHKQVVPLARGYLAQEKHISPRLCSLLTSMIYVTEDMATQNESLQRKVADLTIQNESLQREVADLIGKLGVNSTNSSQSPSQDKYPSLSPKKKNDKTLRTVGGQPGHPGSTLLKVAEPDNVVTLTVDRDTLPPGVELRDGGIETRQVIEIEIKTFVTEYQAEVLIDQYGNRYVAAFPSSVTRPIQYGHSLKSLSVYLSQHQLIPYNRIQEMFRDCFGLSISQGSLVNFNKAASEGLAFFEEEIKSELRSSQVLHADCDSLVYLAQVFLLYLDHRPLL